MSQAEELKDKYEHDLSELQSTCTHEVIDNVDYMWAPGHFLGKIRVCRNCWKHFVAMDIIPDDQITGR